MNWLLQTLKQKRTIALLAGIITAVALAILFLGGDIEVVEVEERLPSVTVTSASSLAGESTISLVGSVRAFSEAAVTAERAGRVTSVNTTLGATVGAGQVLVTLENASENASVLQAQGSYEAALAAAAQSDVGTAEAANGLQLAKNNAVTTLRTAYSTSDGVVRNNIDQFFTNPDSIHTPGLRISGEGSTAALNAKRVAFQDILEQWQSQTNQLTTGSDFTTEIAYAKAQVDSTIEFVDMFITVFNEQERYSKYTQAEITGFSTTFGALRNTLIGQQSQLNATVSNLESAADAVRRAELSASGGTTSAADAQVKQALGSLRAAQANLAKAILRAPVSGTVNELPVRVGDFIGAQTKVAEVANNNALEIVTYASDNELFALQAGDVVTIAGKYEGVITTIAPAVDSNTGKTEVRIATDNQAIKNGDTVRITKNVTTEDVSLIAVRVPLTAVKFERENGFMFGVTDGKLVKFPVALGAIFGGNVEITDGLSITDNFVKDARGLREGDPVEVSN